MFLALIQAICRSLYEYFYSTFYGQVIAFPSSHISVTHVATSSRQIGEGAFSIVLKMKDINDNRTYAVKKMLLQSSENVAMANIEVDSLKQFKHPNIVTLIDVVDIVEANNIRVMYLLLPYYPRGNLREALNMVLHNAVARPPLKTVLRDFQIICDAIRVLHHFQPSYIHQDIKPEVLNKLCYSYSFYCLTFNECSEEYPYKRNWSTGAH